MRIVAGAWRGRTLVAPPGQTTRPTADRVRQALFDMLLHSEWGGRAAIEGAVVADVFAGTGALGLEALSRGASRAAFVESDPAAILALRTNIAACKAQDRSQVMAADATGLARLSIRVRLHKANVAKRMPAGCVVTPFGHGLNNENAAPASLVFLDPPYGQDLVPRALSRLKSLGCVATNALVVAEIGRDETWVPEQPLLAERHYGAARILVFRAA